LKDRKPFTLADAEKLRLIGAALLSVRMLVELSTGNSRRHWNKLMHDLEAEAGKLERRRAP
jgi:hypothetical protein